MPLLQSMPMPFLAAAALAFALPPARADEPTRSDPPDSSETDAAKDTALPDHAGYTRMGGNRLSLRPGLHLSGEDVGFMLGLGVHLGWVAAGTDLWIRPGVFTREVQMSPGRRAQYKELLFGALPWVALEIPLGPAHADSSERVLMPPWKLALVGALELSDTRWYGTSRPSPSESVPSVGLRLISPPGLQFSLRRAMRPGILGHWRGDLACAF